jgi:hypothetical protein
MLFTEAILFPKDSKFEDVMSAFPELSKLRIIAMTCKLSNLSDYEIVYYIPKYQIWIALDCDFPSSYFTYAAFKPSTGTLYLHDRCMLWSEHLDQLKKYISFDNLEWCVIKTSEVDKFVTFLESNTIWLRAVSRVNKYVEID